MTDYAIGDIQGCYTPLRRLLDKLAFDAEKDTLWIAGDMVNRGPDSLATLRFLKSLGTQCIAVLGNHDIHLLAVASGIKKIKKKDTLIPLLNAPDREELIDWLRRRPLLYYCPERQVTMVHAGIPPIWTLKQAMHFAKKVESELQSQNFADFLRYLFKSNDISCPEQALTRKAKLKLITSYLTRMRFCTPDGLLDLENKSAKPKKNFLPWFQHKESPVYRERIVFGHWAALEGVSGRQKIHALDTGCVWGCSLTALNLKTFETTSVGCS